MKPGARVIRAPGFLIWVAGFNLSGRLNPGQPFSMVVADLAGVTAGFLECDLDERLNASGFVLLAVCQTLTFQTCQLCSSQRSYSSSHIIPFSVQLEIFIGVHDPFAPVADWSHTISIGLLEMIKC